MRGITDHIEALRREFADSHDIVDSGGGDDRPTPRPNWAMRCTALLDEIEELIPTRSASERDAQDLKGKE